MQSWMEGSWWWYLCWFGSALTPLDVMVQWKMSCQLMEEPPVAAGRSVATGAMCVNLLPCHFFCLPPTHPPPTISTYFYVPFRTPLSPRLLSLYLQSSVTNYSWRLICWLSKVFLALAWRWGEQEKRVPPPLHRASLFSTCRHQQNPPNIHTHTNRHTLGVEMSQWKLIFCLVRSHQIRCCPCLISS